MLIELLDSVSVETDGHAVIVSAAVGPVNKQQRLEPETARNVADTLNWLRDSLHAAADEVEDA